jgi:DNA-binding MarR family transcriptional regulator
MLYSVCACTKLRRSARIIGALYDEAMAPSGLSAAQFSLLRLLDRAGPSTLTAFAEATGHDRTTLSRTLRPLEEEGLIAFAPGRDRRSRIARLTETGEERMRDAKPRWDEAQREMEKLLGPEQPRLFALLDRIERLRG